MRQLFDKQTATDLEFDVIRSHLAELCHSASAKDRMSELAPLRRYEEAIVALDQASELLQIRDNLSSFPRLEFEELHLEIQRLGITGGVIDLDGFVRLRAASNLMNDVLHFFKGEEELFPQLHALANQAYITSGIVKPIDKVLDQRLEVRDSASSELQRIRGSIGTVRRDISKNFEKVLRKLKRDGYLAATNEAYINDRRVLSVVSSHKRQVAGNVVGNSKSGSFTYIEPQENMGLNNELEMLLDDERTEIRRIFLALTNEIRQLLPLIETYQSVLTEFDFINAKVRLGQKMDARRPAIENESFLELINAYHPLLLLSNKNEGLKTIPQSMYLDKFCRMMVISGPNAGGKSITLKTVGLLQIMIQAGLLVPADESSKFGWFHYVLSDIGDNQSIANQLSTYSYRLKRMKFFLEVANKRSLLLLDEFGTGSDPDLGGALAEVFFETIYNRRSFGIITTHYANIKLKAARLRNAQNASMLFDSESLEPLYQLSVGQPGSSFTFEVAQINGIPQEIIEEAKTRLDANKVEMDKLIATLQKEKSEIELLNKVSKEAEASALEAKEESDALSEHYAERLQRQQQLIEKNNKDLSNGKKMGQFIQSYRMKGQNKPLLEEIRKFLAIEKSKLVKKKELAKVKKEEPITVPKPRPKEKKEVPKTPPKPVVVGSNVRMMNGSNKGEVIEIKGKEATVMFGIFKTKVKASELEVV
jgi:DNA mismatch repair protein MutS2